MLEPWRSRYLTAMGLVSYAARTPLPGAAPSVIPAWDERALHTGAAAVHKVRADTDEVAARAVAVEPVSAPESESFEAPANRQSVAPLLPEIQPPSRKQAHPAAESMSEPRPVAANLSVSLLIVNLRPDLVLIDSLQSIGTPHQQLLANIARSVSGALVAEELFRWPCADHPQLQRHEGAAREAVVGSLLRRLDMATPHDLLLLGDTSHWLNADALALLGGSVRCAVSAPALTDMLRSATAKRECWKLLSTLLNS